MIVRLICRRKTLSPFLMHFAASPRPVSKLPRYLVFLALAGMMSGAVHGQEIHLHPADGSARVNAPGPNQIAQGGSGAAGFVQSGWSFEPNFGQDKTGGARSDARFLAYVHNYLLRLKPGRASLEFRAQDSEGSGTGEKQSTFEVKFVGSNQDAAIAGMERLPGKHSYLPSGDPASWTTGVPLYGRVRYSEIYPRTDLTFYANRGELEYDLVLNPKADPRNIQLELNGADHVQLQSNGDVSVTVNGSPVRLVKPSAYQVGEGERHIPVSVDYKLDAGDVKGGIPAKLTFSLGKYDRRRTLVIDPVVLYGAYIPGPVGYSSPPYYYASTQIRALTADANGNTYVAVSGVSTGAAYSIMKFDPNGNLLLNVSIGSPNTSISPSGIAVDSTGNIYVAGSTRSGLPVTPGAFQAAPPGNNGTGFLTVVKSDGSSLIYSSYFGSAGNTDISGLAVGPTGHAFIAGSNSGGVFPTTPGAYQAAVTSDFPAGFVAQFDPSASGSASLVWSTMLMTTATSPGQSSQSYGSAIAVDSKGDAYVISNSSPGFPLTSGAYAYSGIDTNGVYVTELDPGGDNLIYSAFLGPGYGSGIAVDGAGAAYVTGLVAGADFPVTPGAYQTNPTPGFAAKLSSDGSQLLYSTFLGNPGATNPPQLNPTSIALQAGCASACSAYIAGLTSDNNFPVVNPIQAQAFLTPPPTSSFQVPYTGFLVNLTPDGSGVNYSTYLGALGSTTIYFGTTPEIAADSSGNVYFASNVDGPDAPATLPSVQNPGEGFLTKIGPSNGGAIIAAPAAVTFLNTLTQSITLRNAGSAAVQLQRPFTFGSSEFSETDSCPSPMPGGSACTLNLTFTPTGNGPRSTTLTIASNAPNSPASVSLTVPTDQTNVNVSASALNFPDQVLNTYSDTQTVTITNEGSQAIPVGPITAGEPDYVITSNCPAQLGPGAHCAVNVTFKPTQIGLRAAALDIPIPGTYTFVDGYYVVGYVQIALTGTGVLSASGTGALTFSQSAINFGSDVVNTSTSQSFLVTNSGTAPVTINSIVASTTTGNGAPGDFSLLQVNNNYGY
ncbi:MAG: choice-of-anchor D domain-containing protein, partial [Silvibacterium sp.]|nr:choice-of-anchor D domain-containing protein [Silvibacterium sp.]